MSYDAPTLTTFRARFPVFDTFEDAQVTAILAEATGRVDVSWREVDYAPAIMYLTAHMLATDNSQAGDSIVIGGTGEGDIASESFGGMSVAYRQRDSSTASDFVKDFERTEYGRRYLALLRVNFPPIVAI
jgi:hypothetical protein